MSNIYIKEPPTRGKVLIHTTFGDLDVELWADQAPLACRNFLQLCMEGYYDNTKFHRLIPDMMIQGGDPNGDGSGGESVYGRPFKDELHPRLRFSHRGILAMANNPDKADSNKSQFFFTFAATEWLQGKHTIFGKVTGNTIFNLMKCNELEVDDNDRPMYPPRFLSAEVLADPFDDIVVRARPKAQQAKGQEGDNEKKKKKKKRKAVKNMNLLSFGAEAEDEQVELEKIVPQVVKVRSSFDLEHGTKAHGNRAANSSNRDGQNDAGSKSAGANNSAAGQRSPSEGNVDAEVAEEPQRDPDALRTAVGGARTGDGAGDNFSTFASRQQQRIIEMQKRMDEMSARDRSDLQAASVKTAASSAGGEGVSKEEADREARKRAKKEKKRAKKEAKAKRKEWLRDLKQQRAGINAEKAIRVLPGALGEAENKQEQEADLLSHVQQMQRKFKRRRREVGDREAETLAMLSSFRSDLRSKHKTVPDAGATEGEGSFRVAANTDGTLGGAPSNDQSDDDAGWESTKLKFVRHIDDALQTGGADSNDRDRFVPKKKSKYDRHKHSSHRSRR